MEAPKTIDRKRPGEKSGATLLVAAVRSAVKCFDTGIIEGKIAEHDRVLHHGSEYIRKDGKQDGFLIRIETSEKETGRADEGVEVRKSVE